MRNLILNQDLKTLAQGVSIVAVIGLLTGAAMHPNLRGPEDAAGPRIQMPSSGIRTADYASDPGVSVYRGALPEYVMGADWSRPAPEFAAAAAEPDKSAGPRDTGDVVVFTDETRGTTVSATRAGWRDDPPDAPGAAQESDEG